MQTFSMLQNRQQNKANTTSAKNLLDVLDVKKKIKLYALPQEADRVASALSLNLKEALKTG